MARRNRIARDRSQQVTARIQSQIKRQLPFFEPLDEVHACTCNPIKNTPNKNLFGNSDTF